MHTQECELAAGSRRHEIAQNMSEEQRQAVARALRAWTARKGLTTGAAASLLGVSEQVIIGWLTGQSTLTAAELRSILDRA